MTIESLFPDGYAELRSFRGTDGSRAIFPTLYSLLSPLRAQHGSGTERNPGTENRKFSFPDAPGLSRLPAERKVRTAGLVRVDLYKLPGVRESHRAILRLRRISPRPSRPPDNYRLDRKTLRTSVSVCFCSVGRNELYVVPFA